MKNLITTLMLLFAIGSIEAAPTIAQGSWKRDKDKVVKLYRVVSGRPVEQASYTIDPDGSFIIAFQHSAEGFFVLGDDTPQPTNKYLFYFKPGDVLNVAVNDSTYVLTGENTPENKTMAAWHSSVQTLEWRAQYYIAPYAYKGLKGPSNYIDFFPLLDKVLEDNASFKTTTPNVAFNATFERYKEFDILNNALTMLMTPRTAHPKQEDYIAYYRNINYDKFTSDNYILSMPYGSSLLSMMAFSKNSIAGAAQGINAVDDFINSAKNNEIKGELALSNTRRLKDYDSYLEYGAKYEKYFASDDQQRRWRELGVSLAAVAKSTPTYKFAYPDTNDKMVSLADLKGKVVVVDLWATWCGPCKKEIPFIKELEKEYHGKDVVFVGISTDKLSDKQKWLDFVKKEQLVGIQLFAGQGAEIMDFYKINAIPRFLVYNKKGEIVSADAPRPSSPDLKKMIERELKK